MTDDAPEPRREGWSYDTVPARSWSWRQDPGNESSDSVDVAIARGGLDYGGFNYDSTSCGPYTIGYQTFEAFLQGEPLVATMPADVRAEVRAHVLAHRRPGAEARLRVVAEVTRPQPTPLWQISFSLDEQHLALAVPEALAEGELIELFAGPIAPGAHALTSAVAWTPPRRGNLVYPAAEFTAAAGAVVTVVFEVRDRDASIRVEIR